MDIVFFIIIVIIVVVRVFSIFFLACPPFTSSHGMAHTLFNLRPIVDLHTPLAYLPCVSLVYSVRFDVFVRLWI